MKRVYFSNSRGKTLAGFLYPSDSHSMIVMAHGFLSNQYSKGRFKVLAQAFNHSGFSVLTFDFSGCGESDDDSLTAAKQVDDLRSALRFVQSEGYQRIALYGHSLDSLIGLKCCTPDIATIVLSGALTGPMTYNWDELFTQEQMEELDHYGCITVFPDDGVRERIVVDKQMLMDFEEINQQELLQSVTCPVLIIHGNGDEEERMLLQRSQQGMFHLSKDSRLVVVDGADHSFLGHLDKLTQLANQWYKQHL
ncbi:alpha/beta fold hydrolase [Kroppenstedtia pulmonis]|uniref:Alpha/beta fold hydrolase n=1 Tax=Kroppenstedtia pulmonis TaxID=1380685 RepID=A0A7D3XHH0_9BACL|nr:alpha/beta fold hydrolase [Kroppenstedtia pulmonis]QKG83199.1 alpha/beta fold hydrolase [Kroppenstedtia pulmonis]